MPSRRILVAAAVLALSAALHGWLVAWLAQRSVGSAASSPIVVESVSVSLLPPPAVLAAGATVRRSAPPRSRASRPPISPPSASPSAASPSASASAGSPPASPPAASPSGQSPSDAPHLSAVDPLAEAAPIATAPADSPSEPIDTARGDSEPAGSDVANDARAAARSEPDPPRAAAQPEPDPPRAAAQPEPDPPRAEGRSIAQPPTGQWRFLVFFGDYTDGRRLASVDYRIELDGSWYTLRSEGRAEGLTALLYAGVLSQSSTGRLTPSGLAPERYVEQRGRRPERWARVDPATGRASFSGGESVDAPAGVQDRLSVLIQLGLVARASPERFVAGAVLEVPELTLRDVERARYRVHGDEVLATDSGPIRALHLERIAPRRPDDPRIEAWLGYDRGMLPVRIRLTDVGGRVLDQLSPPGGVAR